MPLERVPQRGGGLLGPAAGHSSEAVLGIDAGARQIRSQTHGSEPQGVRPVHDVPGRGHHGRRFFVLARDRRAGTMAGAREIHGFAMPALGSFAYAIPQRWQDRPVDCQE